MKFLCALGFFVSMGAQASEDVFWGWSKDASWYVFERHHSSERLELFFCASRPEVNPTWSSDLSDKEAEGGCVRFSDPNRAPYRWKEQLALPEPSFVGDGVEIRREIQSDGEAPGFDVVSGRMLHRCVVSGLREASAIDKAWLHPSGRVLAALIDGKFQHCALPFAAVSRKRGLKEAPLKKKIERRPKVK